MQQCHHHGLAELIKFRIRIGAGLIKIKACMRNKNDESNICQSQTHCNQTNKTQNKAILVQNRRNQSIKSQKPNCKFKAIVCDQYHPNHRVQSPSNVSKITHSRSNAMHKINQFKPIFKPQNHFQNVRKNLTSLHTLRPCHSHV